MVKFVSSYNINPQKKKVCLLSLWAGTRIETKFVMAFFSLKTQAAGYSWTVMSLYQTCHFPEDSNINISHYENLRSPTSCSRCVLVLCRTPDNKQLCLFVRWHGTWRAYCLMWISVCNHYSWIPLCFMSRITCPSFSNYWTILLSLVWFVCDHVQFV